VRLRLHQLVADSPVGCALVGGSAVGLIEPHRTRWSGYYVYSIRCTRTERHNATPSYYNNFTHPQAWKLGGWSLPHPMVVAVPRPRFSRATTARNAQETKSIFFPAQSSPIGRSRWQVVCCAHRRGGAGMPILPSPKGHLASRSRLLSRFRAITVGFISRFRARRQRRHHRGLGVAVEPREAAGVLRPPGPALARLAPGEYVISANFNLNALKDAYDYSCFLARLDEYRHVMTYSPGAARTRRASTGRSAVPSAGSRY
jgi:hypothetical protein